MKAYDHLMSALGICAACIVAALTVLVTYDVLARNLGLGSLDWILEVSEYMLPTLISLTAPWLMYRNQHVRLDLLQSMLPAAARHGVERVAAAIGMVAAAVFAWYALQLLLDSRQSGTLVMKALVFPEWWLYIGTPIGFALLAIECARRVFLPATVHDDAAPGGL
ncbi:TRAP transporter small permease [Corticibacter populi]|uniref:TRAP transporter small permease protein n=1 Tax=Corticibacter populi TaxID=1550736 RepID=A0A3M6QX53_9BURK|nr:TRAP transporter small permease [Corticibacter populi]RMX07610.1 TRAP transporter small permease [Corticibacter populi]RZS30110.1 TRAP-type C4-dicarboxylate transport system permease small subunit [Corticibacter populi]